MPGILRAPSSGNPHRPPGRSFLRIARGRFPVLQESATFDFLLLPQWRCDKEFSNAAGDSPGPLVSMDAHSWRIGSWRIGQLAMARKTLHARQEITPTAFAAGGPSDS